MPPLGNMMMACDTSMRQQGQEQQRQAYVMMACDTPMNHL
jgi:hypothetical protein